MTTTTPLAIGTRGTVGSLLRKEIEYFRSLDMNPDDRFTHMKNEPRKLMTTVSDNTDVGTVGTARPSRTGTLNSFLSLSWKRKNRRVRSGCYVPSLCSDLEVADSIKFDSVPRLNYSHSYRNLNADSDSFTD